MKTPRLLFVLGALVALTPLARPAVSDHDKFAAATTAAWTANATTEPMAAGKFQPTWESLEQYETPEWFRDAKFGIWAHWGPQCQPEMGDWYARLMYQSGTHNAAEPRPNPVNSFHVARYGHPTKFGFKAERRGQVAYFPKHGPSEF